MGVFEQFPYVNYHERNLDWLRSIVLIASVIKTLFIFIVFFFPQSFRKFLSVENPLT